MARFLGNYEQARKFWEQNLEIFQMLRTRPALAYPFQGLAWVSLRQGDYGKAKTLFKESLKISEESQNESGIALCLAGIAAVLGMTDKPKQAALLYGTAEFLLENISRLEPADQKDYDHYLTVVHDQLDREIFENARAEGYAMTIEQAIALALDDAHD